MDVNGCRNVSQFAWALPLGTERLEGIVAQTYSNIIEVP